VDGKGAFAFSDFACVQCVGVFVQVEPAEANAIRETIIVGIECWAEELHRNGSCKRWLQGADPDVREVSKTVNGPLLSKLAKHTNHVDPECVEFFRRGSPLYGLLTQSGIGEGLECVAPPEIESLWQRRSRSNALLLASLREDEFSADLMKLTEKDAHLGRMSFPKLVEDSNLENALLAPRFAVEQGVRADGSIKIRAVDNFSWSCAPKACNERRTKKGIKGTSLFALCGLRPSHSIRHVAGDSINGHCGVQEKITHDHLDDLVRTIVLFKELLPGTPHLWKADIDSAFRHACQIVSSV